MDFFSFERTSLRLKEALGVQTDKDLAAQIGMDFSAFNKRKARGSFPEREVLALAAERPELGIDTHYVLTGKRLEASVVDAIRSLPERVRGIRGVMSEAKFAANWGIGIEQLRQIESGHRLPSADLMKRLALLYPEDQQYLLTGARPVLDGPLADIEVILVTNYRASSDEGRAALQHQANFFAQQNADQARRGATPSELPAKPVGKPAQAVKPKPAPKRAAQAQAAPHSVQQNFHAPIEGDVVGRDKIVPPSSTTREKTRNERR